MPIDFSSAEVTAYYAARVPGLRQVGPELRGPCPIHNGKKNSFAVNPNSGQAYCHSQCGQGWDMIGLERELTGVSFATARDVLFAIIGRSSNRSPPPRTVAAYDYTDEAGMPLFQTIPWSPRTFGNDDRMAKAGGFGISRMSASSSTASRHYRNVRPKRFMSARARRTFMPWKG